MSIQLRDASGTPHLYGPGWTESLDGGEVLRVTAPGIALRALAEDPALTLGWQSTLYFMARNPGAADVRVVAALSHRALGIDFGRDYVALGMYRFFSIQALPAESSMTQLIVYDELRPERTRVVRQEVR